MTQTVQQALWPQPIPVIGVTGEWQSGKTLFLLSICPGPQTLVYDTEKSSESYAAAGHNRVDVCREMLARYPGGYKPVDVFVWWRDHMRAIPPGRFRVIAIDTASEIEQGLVEWVRQNPTHFGYTHRQFTESGGLMWGCVNALWKMLLGDLASRCECFAFAVHMGDVWGPGGKPTGKRKAKGKSALYELASLYLALERRPDARGAKPQKPGAVVTKDRVSSLRISDQGDLIVTPLFPPRLPEATPGAIRAYMRTPPDYLALRPDELAPERRISDEDRELTRLATAEAERETEAARLERVRLEGARLVQDAALRALASQAVAEGRAPVQVPAPPVPPAAPATQPTSVEANGQPARASREQLERIKRQRGELFDLKGLTGDRARAEWARVLARRGVATAVDLNPGQADELIANLSRAIATTQLKQAADSPREAVAPDADVPFRDLSRFDGPGPDRPAG